MVSNPELHYLNHVQNTSISKNCHKFSVAPRFPQNGKINTEFKYDIKLKSQRRFCNFGYGNRSSCLSNNNMPGPNHYNINQQKMRSISFSLSRQKVKFGTLGVQIAKKAKIPAPGYYQLPETIIKSNNFTLKQKLPDEIEIKLRNRMPGPGYYNSECLNQSGRYVCSNNRNVRLIIMDANKKQPSKQQFKVGPGSYDLFNRDSRFSRFAIERMQKTSVKTFGLDQRKGPQQRHKKHIPGPGLYETFSSFGKNYYHRHAKSVTQEQ